MTDHYTSEADDVEWTLDDEYPCYVCGVSSKERPVFVQHTNFDPSTWEDNPPLLCQACEASKEATR